MLAIDTNVVVRCLVGDGGDQSARARALVATEAVFVSVTVLLETAWVLKKAYRYDRRQICEALRAFAGLTNVLVEDEDSVAECLDLAENGMDIADAFHVARSADCDVFVTFDARLIAVGRRNRSAAFRSP